MVTAYNNYMCGEGKPGEVSTCMQPFVHVHVHVIYMYTYVGTYQ